MLRDESTDLQLLLCDGDERLPLLADGLPESTLRAAPSPEGGPRGKDSMHLEALDRDPNDLATQRWGVIAPEGEAGDAMLAAVAALLDHRRAQQDAEPLVFRVPDGMDALASLRWKNDVLRAEELPADERPRYLLILGDLDRVSLELQHVLANGSFVGRLHCPTLAGYRDYAEKLVARERGPASRRARALYFTAHDGTAANRIGHRHLVEPCMAMTRDLADRGKLEVADTREIPYGDWGPDEMLSVAGEDAPSMLLSVSHGLGAPRRGWRTVDHQRALQGALAVGGDTPLTADTVRSAPFLPGGVWLCVACYGAGTPPLSAFHPWLDLLAEQGRAPGRASEVLRALPKPGERPFVAALPQALLANPAGPLAVIGHMDLAWTFGFTDPGGKKSRASRLHAPQRALLAGSRVGVALDALMHTYREANDDLTARYQLQRDALARRRPDPVDPRQLGDLWMQRNDLRGYVLLGDPAARLALGDEGPGPDRRRQERRNSERTSPLAASVVVSSRPVDVTVDAGSSPSLAPPIEPNRTPARSGAPARLPPAKAEPLLAHERTASLSQRAAEPSDEPQSHAAPVSDPPPTCVPQALALREYAVLALLRGDEPARSVAVRLGLRVDDLFHWLDLYREAGRRALGARE